MSVGESSHHPVPFAGARPPRRPTPVITAIIAARNEADVIGHVVRDLAAQGVRIYLIDDGSTDDTVAEVERNAGGLLRGVERAPASATYAWGKLLARKEALARELDSEWFIHADADEFRESPWPGVSLVEGIALVDALGYTAIDFAILNFWATHDEFRPGDDVRLAFTRYAEGEAFNVHQVRCWKKADAVDLVASGGHDATFPGRRVFPLRFLLRHYPIRGQAHGERKVALERRARFDPAERARGWHIQYDGLGTSFLRDPRTLTPYDPLAVRAALVVRHRGVEELERRLGEVRAGLEQELARERGRTAQERAAHEAERTGHHAARTELAAERAAHQAAGAELAAERTAHQASRERHEQELAAREAAVAQERAALLERAGRAERAAEAERARAAALELAVLELRRSASWRLTAPLRAALDAVRAIDPTRRP